MASLYTLTRVSPWHLHSTSGHTVSRAALAASLLRTLAATTAAGGSSGASIASELLMQAGVRHAGTLL
jgi:hypothetical protein